MHACAIKVKQQYLIGWKTVGRSPRKISYYVYLFKQKGGVVNSLSKSLNYKPSLIPCGGLEVPLMLTFSCSDEWILKTLKDFVETFYTYDFTRLVANINSDENNDFEIDLDVEAPTEEPVNNSVKVLDDQNAPSVSDDTTRKLLQGEKIFWLQLMMIRLNIFILNLQCLSSYLTTF